MIISVDAGNKDTKIMGLYGAMRYSSHICEYRSRNLDQMFSEDDLEVEYEGKKFFAGSLAENEDEFGGVMMGDSKAHDDAKLRVLIAVHRYTDHTPIDLITGQPIGQHSYEEKQKIKDMLKGSHRLTVNGITKTFVIRRVEVAAEGGSAFWSKPKDGIIRIIDVGSGTINCATIKNKRYIDKDSFTLNFGMNTNKNNDIEALSNGIIRNTSKKWRKGDEVWVCGGSAEVLLPYLKTHYYNIESLKPQIREGGGVKVIHPIFANAVGFYNIARSVYGG